LGSGGGRLGGGQAVGFISFIIMFRKKNGLDYAKILNRTMPNSGENRPISGDPQVNLM